MIRLLKAYDPPQYLQTIVNLNLQIEQNKKLIQLKLREEPVPEDIRSVRRMQRI